MCHYRPPTPGTSGPRKSSVIATLQPYSGGAAKSVRELIPKNSAKLVMAEKFLECSEQCSHASIVKQQCRPPAFGTVASVGFARAPTCAFWVPVVPAGRSTAHTPCPALAARVPGQTRPALAAPQDGLLLPSSNDSPLARLLQRAQQQTPGFEWHSIPAADDKPTDRPLPQPLHTPRPQELRGWAKDCGRGATAPLMLVTGA